MPPDIETARPLVGRAGELDRLARLVGLSEAVGPVGATGRAAAAVLVSGDAGIGKTRLVTALAARAATARWRVVVGHGLDLGEAAPPYLPVSEVLGRLVTDGALPSGLLGQHPSLRRLLPGGSRDAAPGSGAVDRGLDDGLDRGVDRAALLVAVRAALETAASDAPLLVVVEDMHWADASTRDLLTALFTTPPDGRVSIVATYRSDDLHRRHPLRTALAQWARLTDVDRLHLAPLSDPDTQALVRLLHPGTPAEAEVTALARRADGNAFFAEELVAAVAAGSSALPSDLATLLLVRLDRLQEPARRVVRAASAAGQQVTHDLLARVVGLPDDVLDGALRAAVDAQVLVPARDGYAFRHALLAEAAYEDLLPGERVRVHAAYVAALQDGVAGSAAELARHARAAHDAGTAYAASVRAAEEALALGGPEEALRHYETALELLATREPGAATALVVAASGAAAAAGRPHTAIALAQDALQRLPPEAAPVERARLLHALAAATLLTDVTTQALPATTEALRLVPDEPASALRAQVSAIHAHALADRMRDGEAARWAGEALGLAERLGLDDVSVDARTVLAKLQRRSGDPDASRLALQRVVADARASGSAAAELRARHGLGALELDQGRPAEALSAFAAAATRASELGRPWAPYGLDSRVLAGTTAYELGDWDLAERLLDVAGESPPRGAEALLVAAGLVLHAARGDLDARDRLPELRGAWAEDGLVAMLSTAAAIDLHGAAGDVAAAVAAHDDAVALLEGMWLPDFAGRLRLSALLLGQLAAAATTASAAERGRLVELGDEPTAAVERVLAADAVAAPAERLGLEGRAWAVRARAEAARLRWLARGDAPPSSDELVAAAEAWRAAVDGFTAYPHAYERARSSARLSPVLRAAGDAAGAREAGDAARASATGLGARPLLAELRAAGVAAIGRLPERDPVDLTPRETEVLELVALGRSNKQIGAQLVISTKTVSVHVSNVLAKLEAAGRTEAVAIARRRGLLEP